ncbi:hypothetical protein Y032_0323g2494 [Ancylostoma ceylanicum]|uniref:Uncharacterized protein n=1 Tax=Ancylostoma ceylanicum TaxID=53326 RepID=A0A016S0V1_9BILA|nr:hypothetical protein Y032_0323g2494 [Ancylostoma ceylanicum]
MAGNVGTVLFCLCLSIELAKSSDILQNDELFTTSEHDPIKLSSDLKSPSKKADLKAKAEEALSSRNNWGFSDGLSEVLQGNGLFLSNIGMFLGNPARNLKLTSFGRMCAV